MEDHRWRKGRGVVTGMEVKVSTLLWRGEMVVSNGVVVVERKSVRSS